MIKHLATEGNDVAAALALAKREIARRRDVSTLGTYAWALHRSGQSRRAQEVINEALLVGVLDPEMLYHAGFIASAVGDTSTAHSHWRDALRIAPWASQAVAVRALLDAQAAHASLSSQSK